MFRIPGVPLPFDNTQTDFDVAEILLRVTVHLDLLSRFSRPPRLDDYGPNPTAPPEEPEPTRWIIAPPGG